MIYLRIISNGLCFVSCWTELYFSSFSVCAWSITCVRCLKAVDTADASEHTGKTPAEEGLGLWDFCMIFHLLNTSYCLEFLIRAGLDLPYLLLYSFPREDSKAVLVSLPVKCHRQDLGLGECSGQLPFAAFCRRKEAAVRHKDRLISFGILFWLKGPHSGNWQGLNLLIFNSERALSGWSDAPPKSVFFMVRNMGTTCRKAKPCPPGSLQRGSLSLQAIPWDMRTKELLLPSASVQMLSFEPYFVLLPFWERRSTKETRRWQPLCELEES